MRAITRHDIDGSSTRLRRARHAAQHILSAFASQAARQGVEIIQIEQQNR